jgi:glycosyltransferase involved in cell wall biosynthesis
MPISVITIAYNDADALTGTLLSAAAQDTGFEQIVVDGGSDDSSAKVLEDMDSLIDHWISEPDGGIYDAMNKGVAMASGDYVIFMNAGDCFYDHRVIGKAVQVIEDQSPDLFHGRVYARDGSEPYQYNKHLWQGMICSHQSTFARRQLLQSFPFATDFQIVADYNFYAQCAAGGITPRTVDIDVARIDTSGVSFTSFAARTEERMRVCRVYYPEEKVFEYFRTLLRKNGLDLPGWAQNMQAWIDGTA